MTNGAWPSQKVRKTFLDFFAGKDHRCLPSFSLVPANDPTLLFTAAGMAPFKAEFAGVAKPVSPRIATCQKCLRADDIERVGHTSRHHTFFEMLGNFSFGDYFKNEAILWAWELLTQHYKLPAEKLWVSVHTDDDEAFGIWENKIKIPREKLFRLSDNFWGPIGKTGTCGPDSEIYYDRGLAFSCGKPNCQPGCDNANKNGEPCDRFLELWNLVFTMYHKDEDGKLHDLPKKNIDTGAGLERITMILQGADSPFETDLFKNIVRAINADYEKSPKEVQASSRVVADHIRAVTFMIADDVTPSNEGRGYVLQKIIRRAFLNRLNIPRSPSLIEAAKCVMRDMGGVYPELLEKKDRVEFYIGRGEEDFQEVLKIGNELLLQAIDSLKSSGKKKMIPGSLLFRFHDERGFPYEFAKDFLESKSYQVDEAGFKAEMEKQRVRSRGTKQTVDVMSQALKTQSVSRSATEFLGYQVTQANAQILGAFGAKGDESPLPSGENGVVILNKSPFYAENGGQVGDIGELTWEKGAARVLDTQKNEGEVILHKVKVTEGTLKAGIAVNAQVDEKRREQIRKHHTGAHLLHAALRAVLGSHVQQAGSYVSDEYLRLDFSHPQAVTEDELLKIESLINEKIFQNTPVETKIESQEEAKRQGALAFFGEKYGEKVRIVSISRFSKELCGGTHARATGDLGPFVILKESSIAKGIRRIEAKVGKAAVDFLGDLQRLRFFLTDRLKAEFHDLSRQLDSVLADRQDKEKEIARLKKELAVHQSASLLEKAKSVHGIHYLFEQVSAPEKGGLRTMADSLKAKLKPGIVLLASPQEGKVALVCGVTEDLVARGFDAVELLKGACEVVGGGGGGRKDLAEAGGKDPTKIEAAFQKVMQIIEAKIGQRV